jgi:transposase
MGAIRSAETARALIRKTKRAIRRRFPTEDKIRIVIEGMRGEISVAELCRREGIHPTIYYKWLKDFMEASTMRSASGNNAAGFVLPRLAQRFFPPRSLLSEKSGFSMGGWPTQAQPF